MDNIGYSVLYKNTPRSNYFLIRHDCRNPATFNVELVITTISKPLLNRSRCRSPATFNAELVMATMSKPLLNRSRLP